MKKILSLIFCAACCLQLMAEDHVMAATKSSDEKAGEVKSLTLSLQEAQDYAVEQPLIATDFVLQKRSVSRKRIDDYLGITNTAPMDSNFNLSVDYIRPWLVWQYNSLAEFQDSIATSPLMPYRQFNTVESYNAEVARQDSLQQVYTERLRLVIANGQIDDLFKKKSGNKCFLEKNRG